jgi:hypothetical protein
VLLLVQSLVLGSGQTLFLIDDSTLSNTTKNWTTWLTDIQGVDNSTQLSIDDMLLLLM